MVETFVSTSKRSAALLLASALMIPSMGFAQSTPSFSDVPASSPVFEAIEFLREQGVLQGYSDGTFRPNQEVKRSEAAKILVAAKGVSTEQLAGLSPSGYSDIPGDAWYLPYVEWAFQKLSIIDGPPKTTTFNGERSVKKVEFLKMLLLSAGENPSSYEEIKLPLSTDAADTSAWFYPYLRLAIATSIVTIAESGTFELEKPLTRGDVAQALYHSAMYKAGRRTQALLSETENEIVNTLQMLESNDLVQAEYASARALIAARGGLTSKPDVALVKGALKTAEAFRALVRGYRAGVDGKLDDTINLAKEAWNLAAKAMEFSPELKTLATQLQEIAKRMADDARATQAGGGQGSQ